MAWLCWHGASSTCPAAHEGRVLLPLPCQGSCNQPSQEHSAANTPLFTKCSWIKPWEGTKGGNRFCGRQRAFAHPALVRLWHGRALLLCPWPEEGLSLLCPCSVPPAGSVVILRDVAAASRPLCSLEPDPDKDCAFYLAVSPDSIFTCARLGSPGQRGPKSEWLL